MSSQSEQKYHRYMGRMFAVVAEFEDSENGCREANAFMEQNPGVGLLEIVDGRVILAFNDDKGFKAQ